MSDLVDADEELGLELTSRTLDHPSGKTATVFEVWQIIDGRRLPIGNGEAADEASARARFDERRDQLRKQQS